MSSAVRAHQLVMSLCLVRSLFGHLLLGPVIATLWVCGAHAQGGLSVQEAVETEWYVDPTLNLPITGATAQGAPFPFSPDGSRSIFITRKGDLATNTVTYALNVVSLDSAGRLEARAIATFASGSNRPGISQVTWLDDQCVGFVGEGADGVPQVYSVDLSGTLTAHTNDSREKSGFGIGPPGVMVYGHLGQNGPSAEEIANGYIIGSRTLSDVLGPEAAGWRRRISYTAVIDGKPRPLDSITGPLSTFAPFVSVSPSGRYVALASAPVTVPAGWADLSYVAKLPTGSQAHSYHQVLTLVDLSTGQSFDLGAGPIGQPVNRRQLIWDEARERLIALDQFIVPSPDEQALRSHDLSRPWSFEYSLRTKSITRLIAPSPVPTGSPRDDMILSSRLEGDRLHMVRKQAHATYELRDGQWRLLKQEGSGRGFMQPKFSLEIDQAIDRQPQLYATMRGTGQRRVVGRVLNPSTRDKMIPARLHEWSDKDGKKWQGGLILPAGASTSDRLPLIIQTHTFRPEEFIVTGPSASSAGFAAQAFAKAGFAVLTMGNRDPQQHGPDEFKIASEGYRAVIEDLAGKDTIDRKRVGVVAWSRSGFWLQHALAYQNDLFAAAYAADVSTFGSLMYLYFHNWPGYQDDYITQSGSSPFGEGRKNWTERDPVVRVGAFTGPLRIDKYGAWPSWWESYVAMSEAKQPVEYFHLPSGVHSPILPRHQFMIQSTSVDWFRFWILGERSSSPLSPDQYERWTTLCSRRVAYLETKQAEGTALARQPCEKAAGLRDM